MTASSTGPRPRARDAGARFEGVPGEKNAITDVSGVEVGYATIAFGSGPLRVGHGPVRTGVTAILPRGKASSAPCFAGWFSLNGNGEMTGTTWVEESGFLEGPVMLTTTHSVGVVRDAVIGWQARTGRLYQEFSNPVVAETYDGTLNDVHGAHVREEHVFAALDSATGGRIEEGNVGGGTGMVCFQFKGGTGTASRRSTDFTVGVLVQANFGRRHQLMISGVPVGKEIPLVNAPPTGEQGSIIVVVATDAPLLPHQLKRLARRTAMGLARTGGMAGNGSGDIMIAFSTANPLAAAIHDPFAAVALPLPQVAMLPNSLITPLFDATIYATEEAIINALVAADTMTGINEETVEALPLDRLRELMSR